LAVLCWASLGAVARAEGDRFDILRGRWRNYLLSGEGTPIGMGFRASPTDLAARARRAWTTMNRDSARAFLWPTGPIAGGANATSSPITRTFTELETMALAWATPGGPLFGDPDLAAAIDGGLDWMVTNVYTPTAKEYDNWWDWEIGGPQAFNNAIALMYPSLTDAQVARYGTALDGHSPGGSANTYGWQWSTGTIDLGFVMIIRGILGKDAERITTAQTAIARIFPDVLSGNGFYADGSFVLHNNKAYTGAYGVILLNAVADLMNLLEGSPWELTAANKACVFRWVQNAFEPVIYNGAIMDMVRGRTISRANETEFTDGARAVLAIRQIAKHAPPATAAALIRFAEAPRLPAGQFPFAGMDRVVALRDGFGVGLSMSSARIANYESIHAENLHGWFTGDGMTYLYLGARDSQFIGDFWPTVDPYHLPGTTVELAPRADAEGAGKTSTEAWVGGAQVPGNLGTAGMSLANPVAPALRAKKSWFMFDREVVCLGAGITCPETAEVDTTVEDRRLGPHPTAKFVINGVAVAPVLGWSKALTGVSWCALDGVGGYYFPGRAPGLQAAFESRTGSWSDIDGGSARPATPAFTDGYLKLWYNHGIGPANAAYAYVLLPDMASDEVGRYASNPPVDILANTPAVQAVKKASLGVVAANFWARGSPSVDMISVSAPSSVIVKQDASSLTVGLSDPTQANSEPIVVKLGLAAAALLHADPGVEVEQVSPEIIFKVRAGGSLGKTFLASFRLDPSPRPGN
jgi:hyaluronate lyase